MKIILDKKITVLLLTVLAFTGFKSVINAQSQLDSTNFRILDSSIGSSGGISESTNLGLLSSIDNGTADARLTSGTYAIGSGFPSGIQANVPIIRCFETTTTSGTTSCLNFPNGNGATGECGTPGCYDRAKVEIDPQNNPTDTLYLVKILNNATSITYYLQSDHTISTSYDIGDYMTICDIEGKDTRSGSGCTTGSDPDWDAALQSTNIYSLTPHTVYTISVRALSGDYTETGFSSTTNATTEVPTLSLDIDIGTSSAANTTAPHSINFGTIPIGSVSTATNQIWLDMGTNIVPGMTTYVKDLNNALLSGSNTIPSESEDLATDPNANGGYGLKIASSTQTALGPIQRGSTYDTGGSDQVGAVSTSNATIFKTDTTSSNKGPVNAGRASINVKVRAALATVTGNYSDTLTFTMVANF